MPARADASSRHRWVALVGCAVARKGVRVLEMREACERCEAVLAADGAAVICSFECTFCPACAAAMGHRCPNCAGELVARPRRVG